MKEYLFTEFISLQWKSFTVMLITGCGTGILYKIIKKYLLIRIKPGALCVFLEMLFFLTASLFTAGVIDHLCSSKITAYMIIGFLAGVWGSGAIIRK
ncbi:MAG: hypothetical protein IKL72_06675 [Firmicutes bacterium]|nr:hypothetical protein [Bacillota bacterium]